MIPVKPPKIGYNRRVDIEWLDYTVRLIMAGYDAQNIHEELSDYLSSKLSISSEAKRGSREKTITLLLKTWVRVRPGLRPLRDDGLELLNKLPRSQHIAIHWGMTMAAYPFWGEVAAVTGRLLRLQGSVAALQIQRRIREIFGERETAFRSARYVVSAFQQWGALKESAQKGVYEAPLPTTISDPYTGAWIIEALLLSRPDYRASPKVIVDSPSLFPFQLSQVSASGANVNSRLELVQHGLGDDLIVLRE